MKTLSPSLLQTHPGSTTRRAEPAAGLGRCFRPRSVDWSWFVLAVWAGLVWPRVTGLAADFEARLNWTNAPGSVTVSWTSPSLTPAAPFVHYEFQVQHSANLGAWENAVLIPGGFLGSASVNRTFPLPTTNVQGFVRLTYRLNMPGANLSGLDLRGADLRGANLAGANLSGTRLDGALLGDAELTGATLAGATFSEANLQDVNLNGFDLAGLDLSTILGTPRLTQVTANPTGAAAQLVPKLPYNSDGSEFVFNDPIVPGIVSTRHAVLMLKTNATVGQLNALLAARGASIVASSPADAVLPNAMLVVRFPTVTAQALFDLTEALSTEPIVEVAVPDVAVVSSAVPDDAVAASGWQWDLFGFHAGGNWGLEKARVPQMWNVYGALQNQGAARVATCIIDDRFHNHSDLTFVSISSAPPSSSSLSSILQPSVHGNHVAGIVGARYGNHHGIDGVNPLSSLIASELKGFTFYHLVQDIRSAVSGPGRPRIINLSISSGWYLMTNEARPTIDSPFTLGQLAFIEIITRWNGYVMHHIAVGAGSVLLVCAAGNDRGLIPASRASPVAAAALIYGAPNVLVVGSHGMNGVLSRFSNAGGHVAAPGEAILSTGAGSTDYVVLNGTSMATPFISGVAGFLLATAPELTPAELITLIRKNGTNVDAFTSLMEIDQLPSRQATHNRAVLKMLLDIDDGSLDGSLRVKVPPATLVRDRDFELVTGPDFENNDNQSLIPGDGVIDMADFRRWRDWLLFGEGGHALNGSPNHLKLDANGNGLVQSFDDSRLYPRGDFNGDGVLDQNKKRGVPGYLLNVELTDLETFMFSDLWDDPCFPYFLELPGLVDSADFNVSVGNVFSKYGSLAGQVKVAAYDYATRAALPNGTICLSPDEPAGVLTVPVGGPYYLASEPIPVGGGTNVQMRSEEIVFIAPEKRGADYAVDLTLREMTAVANTANPVLRDIESTPDTNRVDAYLGTQPEEPPPQQTVGARAQANEEATLYSLATTGQLPQPPVDPQTNTTFASGTRWQRSFTKYSEVREPRFLLKSLEIELFGFGATTNELRAFAEIIMEIRAYDVAPEWRPIFTNRVEIAGKAASGGQSANFRIIQEKGDFPPRNLDPNGTQGAKYEQRGHRTRIPLDDIAHGHSFELRFQLNTWVMGAALGDSHALARLGDPLKFGSGLRMNYGGYGELPDIKRVSSSARAAGGNFQAAAQSPALIEYLSKTNFYYRLYQGADADTDGRPIAMKLGIDGDDSMVDPAPLLANPTEDDYTLENQPIEQPLDFDSDGIDDVYELRHPAILDPLNAADSFLDPDGDGRSNLEEYQDGTDPQTPDAPPTHPTLNFPGLMVPSYTGGALLDINNDGLLDSVKPGLNVALAHLGGTFDVPSTSPLTGIRVVADTAYVRLDGDAYPDAVLIDFLTNRVYTFRGVGDGTFTPLTNYSAIDTPSLIASCNLNGDALKDLAIFSQNGRGVDLHLNNGDGTLTRTATVTNNAYGSANSFAMADLNNDSRDDVIVAYSFNVVVFLTQPNGSYGPAQPYPVGSFPSSIAVGDLNHDGRLDIVAVNSGTGELSVLMASAPGTFLPEVRYPAAANARQVHLVQLDGNTHLDAVVSLNSVDYQVILPGVGDGTFGPRYPVPTGTSLTAIHDWNGDGKLDFVSTTSSGGLINLGNGDGTFDTRQQIVPTNNPPSQVRGVDLNGDGKLELVGLQTQLNSLDVWEHAAVTGTNRLLASLVVGPSVTSYATGDFNSDGRIDLAVLTKTNSFGVRGSNQVVLLLNQGNFQFQEGGHYPLDLTPNSIVAGDFNGDGHLDLAAHLGGGTLVGGLRLVGLLNNGAGGFQIGPALVVGNTASFFAPVNADSDTRDEVVLRGARLVGNASVNYLEVFALDAGGGWTNRQTLAFTNNIVSQQVVSMNGDAYPDLVVMQSDPFAGFRSFRMYPGGPGGFGPEQILADAVEFSSFSRLADLNGDGLPDVAVFNSFYLAKPGGGFHPVQNLYIGPSGVQGVADFNRDGKADLLNGLSILLQK